MNETTRSRGLSLLSLLLLVLLTAVSLWTVWPPAPAPADAPADTFSAERAFEHVEVIGQEVHPAGSAAAGDVRDYLVDTLTDLGLEPEVVEGVGATGALGSGYGLAAVENVVAVVPGHGLDRAPCSWSRTTTRCRCPTAPTTTAPAPRPCSRPSARCARDRR